MSEIRQQESDCAKIADKQPALQIVDDSGVPPTAKARLVENLAQYIARKIKRPNQQKGVQ